MKNGLRILIVDDHEIVRRGVRSLLATQRRWKIVGEASHADEAIEKTRRLRPDLVLLDISLGDGKKSGLDVAREIRGIHAGIEVLILTMHEAPQVAREVLAAGARGFVTKADAEEDLVKAVLSVSRGEPFFSSKGAEAVLGAHQPGLAAAAAAVPGDGVPAESLTPRQIEIVRLLAEGKSNKAVAAALDISVKTVETHRANIMRRLRIDSLSHLVRYAIREGLVQP